MRAAIVALVAFLLLAIALPARHAAVEELPGRRRALRRPRQLRPLLRHADAGRLAVEQLLGGGAVDRPRRAAGVRLRLRAHAHAHAGQAGVRGARAAAAVRAVAAVGHLVHLHLRQPGLPEELADGRHHLWADRHRAGAGVLLLPARADDPGHGPVARRRAALRGGGRDGHAALARVLDRHAAGRALRADLGGVRRLHAGHHRLRHRQGDRRTVQRARHRRLQAGDRPAELRDGRGGGLRAAGAGGDRLRARPADPAPAGGAAVGARRAVRAQAQRAQGCRARGSIACSSGASSPRCWACRCGRRSSPTGPTTCRSPSRTTTSRTSSPTASAPTSPRCRWRRWPPCSARRSSSAAPT